MKFKLLNRWASTVTILGLLGLNHVWAAPKLSPTTTEARPSAGNTSGNLGLGIMFGEPTGLTMKYWLSGVNAFDLGLSYSFGEFFEVLADYLWHFPQAFSGAENKVAHEFIPYIGIGGVLFLDTQDDDSGFGFKRNNRYYRDNSRSDIGLGIRIPLGIEFLPHSVPLGVFVEVAPGLGIAPSIFGFIQGVIGARYYL